MELDSDTFVELIAAAVRRGLRAGLTLGVQIAKENVRAEFKGPKSVVWKWEDVDAALEKEIGEVVR